MFTIENFKLGEILLVDKPQTWTSFDVVNKLRYVISRKTGKIKVGHAGTLDPMATGLLIICTGKKTKALDSIQAEEKEYTGTLQLGAVTASYDADTAQENQKPFTHITAEEIHKATKRFLGNILQTPPIYSAIKINGVKAYDLARDNQKPDMPPRQVEIFEFEISNVNLPFVDFKIHCSKGTYVRSLVHDLGQTLGCGAFMTALRRTQSGSFRIENAWNLQDLIKEIENL
ncbi:MAG TPA: tRNA pseudouridine(55) synthase TruB [Chitinophagales bacterium]